MPGRWPDSKWQLFGRRTAGGLGQPNETFSESPTWLSWDVLKAHPNTYLFAIQIHLVISLPAVIGRLFYYTGLFKFPSHRRLFVFVTMSCSTATFIIWVFLSCPQLYSQPAGPVTSMFQSASDVHFEGSTFNNTLGLLLSSNRGFSSTKWTDQESLWNANQTNKQKIQLV